MNEDKFVRAGTSLVLKWKGKRANWRSLGSSERIFRVNKSWSLKGSQPWDSYQVSLDSMEPCNHSFRNLVFPFNFYRSHAKVSGLQSPWRALFCQPFVFPRGFDFAKALIQSSQRRYYQQPMRRCLWLSILLMGLFAILSYQRVLVWNKINRWVFLRAIFERFSMFCGECFILSLFVKAELHRREIKSFRAIKFFRVDWKG